MLVQLDKPAVILQMRANPADKEIYEFFYCVDCQAFVTAGGLLTPLEQQSEHLGHRVAWMPGQDSFLANPRNGHIFTWLERFQPFLSEIRYEELCSYAHTTDSGNWVWLLSGAEQSHWLAFLADYLDSLAEDWLAALNGKASGFFPAPQTFWRGIEVWSVGSTGQPVFEWHSLGAGRTESLLLSINPLVM